MRTRRPFAVAGLMLVLAACGGGSGEPVPGSTTAPGSATTVPVTVTSDDGVLEVAVTDGTEVTITPAGSPGDLGGLIILAGPYLVEAEAPLSTPALLVASLPITERAPLALLARVRDGGRLEVPDQTLALGTDAVHVLAVTTSFSPWVVVAPESATVSAYAGDDLSSLGDLPTDLGVRFDGVICGQNALPVDPALPDGLFPTFSGYRAGHLHATWSALDERVDADLLLDTRILIDIDTMRLAIGTPDLPREFRILDDFHLESATVSTSTVVLLAAFGAESAADFAVDQPIDWTIVAERHQPIDPMTVDTCVDGGAKGEAPVLVAGVAPGGRLALGALGIDPNGAARGTATAVFHTPEDFPAWLECGLPLEGGDGECRLFDKTDFSIVGRAPLPGSFLANRGEYHDAYLELELEPEGRFSPTWSGADRAVFTAVTLSDPTIAADTLNRLYGPGSVVYLDDPTDLAAAAAAGEPIRFPIPFTGLSFVVFGSTADGINAAYVSLQVTPAGLAGINSVIDEIDAIVSIG